VNRLADVETVQSTHQDYDTAEKLNATEDNASHNLKRSPEPLQLHLDNQSAGMHVTSLKRSASPLNDERPVSVAKRRRLPLNVRQRTVFNPVAEHRPWCPWVSSPTESENKPWLRLLRSLLTDAPSKLVSVDASSTPEALECIRNLFRSWASSVTSH
jgi:hypothetical protein